MKWEKVLVGFGVTYILVLMLGITYLLASVSERTKWCEAVKGTMIERKCYTGVQLLEPDS